MAQFTIFRDAKQEWRWRFQASNWKIVAVSSEGYQNKADCLHAIDLVKKDGPSAPVKEE